eukprot:Lankesteria_metandrocarpae@DN4681_c0_g1_i2.p1
METVKSLVQSWSSDIIKLRKRLVDAGIIQCAASVSEDVAHNSTSGHVTAVGCPERVASHKSIGRSDSLQRGGSNVSTIFRTSSSAPYEEDNLHLARYLKSLRGDVDRCVTALRRAKIWRNRNRKFVEECRNAAAKMDNSSMPTLPARLAEYGNIILRFLPSAPHNMTLSGEPIVIVRFGIANMRALCEVVPQPVFRDFMVFSNEWEFWQCDYLSRYTGRMHRCYRFVDLAEVAVKNIDKRLMGVISESSKLSDVLHPQMTAKTVFCNTPSLLKVAFTAFKRFGFSARAAEKFHVVKKSSQGAVADDVVKSLVDSPRFPSFFGGTCRCTNGCIPGLSNDFTKTVTANIEELKKAVVLIEGKYVKVQRSVDSICENYIQKFDGPMMAYRDTSAKTSKIVDAADGDDPYTTGALSTTSDCGEIEGGGGGSDEAEFLSEVVLSGDDGMMSDGGLTPLDHEGSQPTQVAAALHTPTAD